MPKQPPTISVGIGKLQLEEVLYVASSFIEGAKIEVTRAKVGRLLKDYDIAWWFAPLNSMKDVGSADLIARLLTLQHQGVNEKDGLPERLLKPLTVVVGDYESEHPLGVPAVQNAKIEKEVLTFDYITPLQGTNCKTSVKAYLRDSNLIVIW
eukprot:CAMPEP_0119035056 /NCGR_PEP_ID=MMETSP1177-20130426/2036_1 /TAXON_ID=2985 /ORGANISM="Ochromonas sp, Strain CCMP1899" /LENGTH=151 /DNA_ID=CAMNT_0006992945 /DNA_START=425 /DNA_END=877 /DNA_ORIENTATION=+